MVTEVSTSFSTRKKERVSSHSHITGLGIDESGGCLYKSSGLVGQCAAREAAGLVVELVRNRKMAGRAVLFAGPSGTGKTALAMGISKELGAKIPFTSLVGSEVYSAEIKKTEVLMEGLRRSIGIVVKEIKEVYEGEVTEVSPIEVDNPHGGYGKTISHVDLGLRTTKGTKKIKMDSSIYSYLECEKVAVGDVIYIEANSGIVKKMGRCDVYAAEHDLETEEYVPLPKGEIYKRKEIVQRLSLHDLDAANARPENLSTRASSALSGLLKPRKTEITDKLRLEVNKMINKLIADGTATLVPGVLFIDEVHMLDIECYTFLNKVLESSFTPIVILATNRGVCTIRGTNSSGAHGMPAEMLDRLLIIRTVPYTRQDIGEILQIRCRTEALEIEEAALDQLASVGAQTSLRFALHLLSPASIYSSANERNVITPDDVAEVLTLFQASVVS